MFKRFLLVALLTCLVPSLVLAQRRPTPVPDPLAGAREAYNAGRLTDAIDAASAVARTASLMSAASVVLARAHLEQARTAAAGESLTAARAALARVDTAELSPRDHVEYLIAMGQFLYLDVQTPLDDRYAAAAEFFEAAFGQVDLLDSLNRDLLFEWWAMALDQQAQQNPPPARGAIYERIVARASVQVARADASASALYWLAAGASGANDPQRAWGAVVAGWIRSYGLGNRGAGLRVDLDRLMTQAVLPGRVRQLAAAADQQMALDEGLRQWADFKKKWDR